MFVIKDSTDSHKKFFSLLYNVTLVKNLNNRRLLVFIFLFFLFFFCVLKYYPKIIEFNVEKLDTPFLKSIINNIQLIHIFLSQVNEEFLKSTTPHEFYEHLNGHLNKAASSSSANSTPPPIHSHYETPKSISPTSNSSGNSLNSSSSHQIPSSSSLPELQTQVHQLEERVIKETQRRKSLENAVKRLTEENRKLQNESQAAVQQLRRFTEWFFQTIDRQS